MKLSVYRILHVPLLFISVATWVGCSEEKRENSRLNILWIMADDLGPDLSCYGTPEVFTPNLDRLAMEGTRYTNMFTVAAVSSVSRSAMITGMYPVSINCHQHRTQFKSELPDPVKPITEYFREAGYYVSNCSAKDCNKFGKTDYNFIHSTDSMYDGTDWSGRKEGQPFFAQIQISNPHRPFISDKEHPVNPEKIDIPPCYPDHPITRKDWALYLESVQAVDRQVGIILARLENEGLLDNTVVFFFGDQGQPHMRSKQFMYEEGCHTPLIVRWPGMLKPNTVSKQLISNVDLSAEALDIANIPVPSYMHGQIFIGEVIYPREYIFSMRDRRDETVDRIRSVRSERYRYIRNFYPELPYTQPNAYKKFNYPVLTLMCLMHKAGTLSKEQDQFMAETRPEEELYDIQNDPFCLNNLANNIEFCEIKNEMSNYLGVCLEKYDKGIYPENECEIKYAKTLMERDFTRWMAREGLPVDISDEDFLEWWVKKLNVDVLKTN